MSRLHRILSGALLLLLVGCASRGGGSPRRVPRKQEAPPETQLILLNVPEASGWVAYGNEGQDSQEYRIVVTRASDGQVIYSSQVFLSGNLKTHGFEMAEDDARLLGIARQVDSGILAPLQKATPETTSTMEDAPAAPAPAIPLPSLNVLEGIEVLSADADGMVLRQSDENLLSLGDRIFLRTPPEFVQDDETGGTLLLSRGRVAALLEVTEVNENQVTLTRRSGEIPAEGYFEKATD